VRSSGVQVQIWEEAIGVDRITWIRGDVAIAGDEAGGLGAIEMTGFGGKHGLGGTRVSFDVALLLAPFCTVAVPFAAFISARFDASIA